MEIPNTALGLYTVAKTTKLDANRTRAYASGINDTNEAFFDEGRPQGLKIHPGIGFSLQWNSRFRPDHKLPSHLERLSVHAETDLRIVRPFKAEESITTQGQLVYQKQIKPGVFCVDRYRMTDQEGNLVAELDYNGIIRGASLTEPAREVRPIVERPQWVGQAQKPVWVEEIFIPEDAGQKYTDGANIYNPIHTEPNVAKAVGLPGIILHGSATKAIALSQVIDRCFDREPDRVTRLYGQLRGMVLMSSRVRVQCMGVNDRNGMRSVLFEVFNEQGEKAITHGVVEGRI